MMPGVLKAWLARAGSTGTYLFPDIALGAGSAVLCGIDTPDAARRVCNLLMLVLSLCSYPAVRSCSVALGGKRVFSGHKLARKPTNEGPVFSRLYGKSKRGKIGRKSANSLRDWRKVSVFIQFSLCENRWNTSPSLAGFLSVFGQLKSLLPPCVDPRGAASERLG